LTQGAERGFVARVLVLFASSNFHKISEVKSILAPFGLEVVGLDWLEEPPSEPIEDGDTFEDNARLKARGYARATGQVCLADDSGLEVDALGGAPGVHSARYAGSTGSRAERDRANNEKLLGELQGRSGVPRTARFVCALCLARPDGTLVLETRGTCEGVIAHEPRGDQGFGYDPLLYLPDCGLTLAELSPEDKNARSHRGRATRAMADALRRHGGMT
jgi:XTP/dITP diphosphohydrolase